jgi:hypothetical protein
MTRRRQGPNRAALERTLRQLDGMPEVSVQMLRSLADAVDVEPTRAALWREYREALREVLADRERDEGLEELLGELRGAEMGDPAERAPDARS